MLITFNRREYLELEDNFFIPVILIEDLLKNKASTGRKKDEPDMEELLKYMR